MIWIIVIVIVVVILLLFFSSDLLRLYKKTNYTLRCNKCGSTNTVIKNNDVKEKFFSYDYHVQDYVSYTVHNPQTFICNECKQEYNINEGTFIKKKNDK